METKFRASLKFSCFINWPLNAFDCVSNELVTAKLRAYGVDISTNCLIYDYLTNLEQRLNIKNYYSSCSWRNLIFGVHQGLILRPLLLDIYPCDMFINNIDITSYVDYITISSPNVSGETRFNSKITWKSSRSADNMI